MSDPDALPPDEVIDAADDDLVDIDGAPTDPLSAVPGSGGFDCCASSCDTVMSSSTRVVWNSGAPSPSLSNRSPCDGSGTTRAS